MQRMRVGIDVGGTFTHAVAIDNATLEVAHHAVTPTTHHHPNGVAEGIVQVFGKLLEHVPEAKVVFLAHSTTQATNALLEGDVVKVGIVGLGSALDLKARADMEVGSIELAPGKFLHSQLIYVSDKAIQAALGKLQGEGCGAIAAAQPMSVDDSRGEAEVMEMASAMGLPACGSHEMSGLYGLQKRTRTAVLNASILPKMIETAVMTESGLRQAHVEAPLMVMRSDGGVMSLDEVRKRPVLTLLSGPAAGIAAALVFLRASDAIFLEVGGTSTDICLIKDGRAAIHSATLGGHPTFLKTLDSRTLGVAGGSMLRAGSKVEVGPRSAHLAGCSYACFTAPEWFDDQVTLVSEKPLPDDPDYWVFHKGEEKVAVTTTCAANWLGFVPSGGYSLGNLASLEKAFACLHKVTGLEPVELATKMLDSASEKVIPTIRQLIVDYKVGDRAIKLIGGGGGAAAIVPYVARKLDLPHEIAPRAEVISAIGAALAMVKETLERNLVNPSQSDLAALRSEAEQAVIRMGADPDTVDVQIEVDSQRNQVRAMATGSVAFVAQDLLQQTVTEEERLTALREAAPREQSVLLKGQTDTLYVYESQRSEKYFLKLFTRTKQTVWITDGRGGVKLQVPGGKLVSSPGDNWRKALESVLQQHTDYGDAGALLPAVHVVAGRKLVDLTSLQTTEQVLGLAQQELAQMHLSEHSVFFLIHPRN
ncbi:hydantoinase/oxoprolinase family protein [bacterium]|nr:hydantoinase/oxoprolinase family protein [bacterium]